MPGSHPQSFCFTRRRIALAVLLTFLPTELVRGQNLLEKQPTLNPYETPQKTREEEFISQEEFSELEAREKFLEQKRADLELLRREAEGRNRQLIEEQARTLRETMELQKEVDRQRGEGIRGKAVEIQSRMAQAGERYILYKDGKKVTFKAGLTIRVENEKVKDKLGNVSVRNTVDMQYDKKNRLVSYNQVTADPLGNVTRVEWRNGTYWSRADQAADPLKVAGKLAGYTETIHEPTGLVTTRAWSQLQYYTKGTEKLNPAHVADQLAGYRVESVGNDASDAPRVTEFSGAEYLRRPATPTATDKSEEDDILLSKFHEKSTVLGVTTERDFFDAQYNEHEQLVGYREVSTTLGVTTEKEWKNASYDSLGRLTSFDEITTTEGITTVRNFREAQYNNLGQLISYTEVRTTQGLSTVTKFSDATYDSFGRLASFKNVITENGVTFTQIRSDIQYNSFGQVVSYFDIVERLGVTTETRRSNISYDAFGRVFGYTDEIHEFGGGLDRNFKVVRESTEYNKLGQETGYKETIFEPNGFIREVTRSNQTYNAKGQLVSFFETVRERGSMLIERIFRNAVYDGRGRLVSFEEEIRDSSRPGVAVIRQRFDQVYDAQNRLVSYREWETTTGSVTDPATGQTFSLNQTVLREKTGIVYNALSQEIAYLERLTDAAGIVTERILLDAEYDPFGRVIRYKEKVTAAGETITRERSQILFDSQGRAVSYLEVVTDAAGVQTTTFRKGTLYNVADLPVAYLEEVRSSTVPNEVETIRFSGALYDSLSRLISFTQERTSLLTGFRDLTVRETTEYSATGQLLRYAEKQSRYFGSQLVSEEKITRSNALYNEKGNLTSYDQVVDRTWLKNTQELVVTQDRISTLFRDGVYDEAGRLLSYSEEEKRQVAGEAATAPEIRNWTRSYAFDSLAAVEDNWLYYGAPSWNIQNGALVWDTLAADPLKTSYILQGVSLGDVQGYTVEVALQVEAAAADGALTLFWKGSENGLYFYFKDGSITNGVTGKVYTTATSDAVHTYRFVVKERQLYLYKDGVLLGSEGIGNYKFSGFEETLTLTNAKTRTRLASLRYYAGAGVEPVATLKPFSREVGVKRNRSNSYDPHGVLSGWVETSSSSAEPGLLTTTTTGNITYDAQKRETGYTQTEVRTSVAGAPSYNLTRVTSRNAITYDEKNRVTGYHEERSSSDMPEKIIKVDRTAVQYTARGEVASYEETLTELNSGGKSFVTEQAVQLAYNNFGDLERETTLEKVTTLPVILSEAKDLPLNQLISVSRRAKTAIVTDPLGVELHSVVNEENLTEAYQSTEYNAALRQFGSTITSSNPFNPFAGYVTDFNFLNDGTIHGARDGSYMNQGAVVTLTLDQMIRASKIELGFYLGANQIGNAYRVDVSSDGQSFDTIAQRGITEIIGPNSHLLTFPERDVKAIRFIPTAAIGPGGTFYLSEIMLPKVILSEAKDLPLKQAITLLDSLGLRAKYTTTTRATRQANALGQITDEEIILTKRSEGEVMETTRIERRNQKYNALGLVSSLHEETSTVMTTWQSLRNVYFYLTTPYPLSVNHLLYNYIGTPQSFDYNGHGHYVGLGHLAPTNWDIYQSSDRAQITYNDKGQVTGYQESGLSRPFGGNYSLTRSEMNYNSLGEVVSFKESGQTQSAGSYNFKRDLMVYGGNAVVSYHETGANSQDGPYETNYKVNKFDGGSRPVEIEESGTKNAAPYHFTRTNITYNANELPTSWKETGLRSGATYNITRHMTRYNNMGQVTDFFEEGTRSGGAFWEMTSTQAYDLLGRFFKNQTRSGTTPYFYTFDGTRAFTFYDAEGRVSSYQNYFGPVFIDVTGIQYDAFGRIIAYTESTRGGGTRQVFGIQYDASGRIISQQFTDTSFNLLFGEVSTQTFLFDGTTGKLLQSRIENGDFTVILDGEGNQVSLALSARMQAFLEEQEARAKEAAGERRRSKSRAERADDRFAPKDATVLSRTEKTDKKGNRRITEVFELTDKEGRKHKVRETRRLDADGNLLSRQIVDNFSFRNEKGKKIRARIASYFDGQGHLTKSVEKYKQRMKGGTQITKRTTLYDSDGNLLKQKTKQDFKKSGFFGSTIGKILGIALVVGASLINPALGAAVQFGLSMAQGAKFLEALVSATAVYVGAKYGPGIGDKIGTFLGKIPVLNAFLAAGQGVLASLGKTIGGAINNALKPIGQALSKNISQIFTRTATQEFLMKFTQQFTLWVGSEVFAKQYGKKLGAFGTVATLAVMGSIASGSFSAAIGSPIAPGQFGANFADSVFSGSIRGGIAEALKNERSLGAQFLNIFSSSVASNISLSAIEVNYKISSAIKAANALFKEEGITISDIQDAVVLPNKDLLVLFKKNETLQYALVPSKQYSEKSDQNSNKTVTDNLIEFSDDVFKQYQRYQAQAHSNFVGVGGADTKQVPAAGSGSWKDRSSDGIHTGNVLYGDPAHYHKESGVGYILEGLQETDFDLKKQFYQNVKMQGIDLGADFLLGFPHVLSTVIADGYTFTGKFNADKTPIIQTINPRVGIKVYNVSSPAYFFSPGNPVQLANALESSFRNQDVNVVVAHSYGGPTAVEAARILESRGVKIDYMALIDPSGRGDLVIPSNVRNVRLIYQEEERGLISIFTRKPNQIVSESGMTNILSPSKIKSLHINIDNKHETQTIIKRDYSNIYENYMNGYLFFKKYEPYIKNLYNSFKEN